jgi:CHAT domain-containing protein
MLYYHLNDCVQAKPLYQSALNIFEQTYGSEHPMIAQTLHNLALCESFDEDYEPAEKYFQRALSIYKKVYESEHSHIAIALKALGTVNLKQHNYEEAMRLFREALTMFETNQGVNNSYVVDLLVDLTVLELLYDKIDGANAELQLQRALLIAIQTQIPFLIGKALFGYSILLYQQQNSAAIMLIKQSLNILQSIRGKLRPLDRTLQHSFIQNKAIFYQYAAVFLIEQDRLAEALQILEMYKEEEYFDFTRDHSTTGTTQVSYTVLESYWVARYTRLIQQLTTLGHEKRDLERTFSAFLVELKTAFKQATPEQITKTPIAAQNHLDRLQNTLRELGKGTVLVHYLITENKLYILLSTSDAKKPIVYQEINQTQRQISRQVFRFRRHFIQSRYSQIRSADEKAKNIENVKKNAETLYDWLIKPIEKQLTQKNHQAKTLMLSLDGVLRYLPMAALYDGKQYLAERYAIVRYSQVAKNTLQRPPKPLSQWKMAGLGMNLQANVQGESFDALAQAETELEQIIVRENENDSDGLVPGKIYLNDQFTAETMQQVLTENYSLLHISSHFKLKSPGTDLSSYLLLGDGTVLSLAEMRKNYDFDGIDLLTLSACETAISRQTKRGREIDGFAILAQNKGAKGILATLWQVNSPFTSQFMPAFYQQLTDQNVALSKAEALQQVQKTFIQTDEYAHPYYWAPFILMGNWR